jgi:hypothetical protein
MTTKIKHLALGVLTLFFIYAAYLQLNDPHPFVWVSIYGCAALLTLFTLLHTGSSLMRKCMALYGVVALIAGCKSKQRKTDETSSFNPFKSKKESPMQIRAEVTNAIFFKSELILAVVMIFFFQLTFWFAACNYLPR